MLVHFVLAYYGFALFTGGIMRVLRKYVFLFVLSISIFCSTQLFALEQSNTDEYLFGMSTALTGPAKDLGQNMLAGFTAGFERANRQGGVKGKMLRVLALDDGYEPSRTTPNMRDLTDNENVLAIVGNVGTPTAIAAIPIANERKTLLFAPYTGAGVLRKTPPDRYVINYRASYAQETAAMIDALINVMKYKIEDIAFFTQRDGYGDAGYQGGITALKNHGLENESQVLHVRYERNTLAVEDAVAEILLAGIEPKAIILVGAYAPCAKFIELVKENELNPLFLNVSFVGSQSLAAQLGDNGDNVIVTQVVPHYNSDLQIVKDYRADIASLNANHDLSFGSLEGYIASRILIEALDSIQESPTRENIIDALESLGNFDLGLGKELRLDKDQHQASNKVWPTILKNGQFVSFEWSELKQ